MIVCNPLPPPHTNPFLLGGGEELNIDKISFLEGVTIFGWGGGLFAVFTKNKLKSEIFYDKVYKQNCLKTNGLDNYQI